MRKKCEECGEQFEAKRSTAKYCSNGCRVQAQRGAANGKSKSTRSTVVAFGLAAVPPDEDRPRRLGPLEQQAQAELESFGRAETLAGGVVLALARRIDQAGPADTGSGFAALAKELRAAMAVALAGAEQEADPIDQVRKQREQKQRSRGAR
ncbi:hypothetical protein [Streptomyces sp. NPDC048663]|uniref:hypothetical protein n=1 Tax=Streptomyces sp. NPDC048663 TaxID=3155638 RepID=UPI00342307F6